MRNELLALHEELRNEAIEAELALKTAPNDRYWIGRLDGLALALTLLANVLDEIPEGVEPPSL